MATRQTFVVRPLTTPGLWYTDVSRYHDWAREQLSHLRALNAALEKNEKDWPPTDVLKTAVPPSRWSEYLQRCMYSDSAIVFAAMAVEGFLNLYGVVRFGETTFSTHMERLGVVPKLRQLILFADGIDLQKDDPLVRHADLVAQRRNELVHPKTKEATASGDAPERWKRPVLSAAEESIESMRLFFLAFQELVPDSGQFLPNNFASAA